MRLWKEFENRKNEAGVCEMGLEIAERSEEIQRHEGPRKINEESKTAAEARGK